MYPASPLSTPPRKSSAPRKNKAVVSEILSMLGLSHHQDSFSIHCVETMIDLQMLTEEQMKEMGVWKVGERNRLKRWIDRKLASIPETSPVAEDEQSAVENVKPVHSVRVRRKRTVRRTEITVVGAGILECNGVYAENGKWDGVPKFVKIVDWAGLSVEMVLFRHRLEHDTQIWFISIVPKGRNPGSSQDIAFYSSQSVAELDYIPPTTDWLVCSPSGKDPAPSLQIDQLAQNISFQDSPDNKSLELSPERPWRRLQAEPRIKIDGAGSAIVNGIYASDGTTFDGCRTYKKSVVHNEKEAVMTLFRCLVRGNERCWYLSIVSEDNVLGTVLDLDFYFAKTSEDNPDLPPSNGWVISDEGDEPCPTVTVIPAQSYQDVGDASGADVVSVGEQRGRLRVEGSSLSFINGLYDHRGTFDNVPKYQKPGFWRGSACVFTVFRFPYKNNRRRWYISIVPLSSSDPGTTQDIDFYAAPASLDVADGVPPRFGWTSVNDGVGQAPTVSFVPMISESTSESGREEATTGDEITTSVSGMTTEGAESPNTAKTKGASSEDEQTKKADDGTSETRTDTASTDLDGKTTDGGTEPLPERTVEDTIRSGSEGSQEDISHSGSLESDDGTDATLRTTHDTPQNTSKSWDPFEVLVSDVFGLGLSESPDAFDGPVSPRPTAMER